MELLGDMGHVESHWFLFGDNVSVGARLVHGLLQMYICSEIILDVSDGTPSWQGSSESLVLVGLEIRAILMQDRCTVCVARAIGSDSDSDNVCHVESHFFPFENTVSVSAR
jgi:hypothetical protein